MSQKAILIGLAGGTASGKTSMAKAITTDFPENQVAFIEQDSYYFDLSHLTMDERNQVNVDHPDSMDFDLMTQHIDALIHGGEVEVPYYEHASLTRIANKNQKLKAPHIIVLEGIFALYNENLRKRMDIKIFVDTPDDIRVIRRIKRDMASRGRDFDSIIKQYYETVRPMHQQFIEPTKRFADIIVPEGSYNTVAIDLMRTKIKDLLKKRISL